MEPTVIGSQIPSTLLRAFERPEYAAQFIRGKVRFGRLGSYKSSQIAAETKKKATCPFDGIWKTPWTVNVRP